MYENEIKPQTAVLVAVDTGEYDIDVSLDELEELAATAGAQVIRTGWCRSAPTWMSPPASVPGGWRNWPSSARTPRRTW